MRTHQKPSPVDTTKTDEVSANRTEPILTREGRDQIVGTLKLIAQSNDRIVGALKLIAEANQNLVHRLTVLRG